MKKSLKVLIISLFSLTPLVVKADVAMPEISYYKAIVSNSDGAKCYDVEAKETGEVKSYTTEIEISYEYTLQGITYVYADDYASEETCFLKTTDISIVSSPNEEPISDLRDTDLAFFTKTDGVVLRSGPSSAFDIVKEVSAGTVLKSIKTQGYDWFEIKLEDGTTGWLSINIYSSYLAEYIEKDLSVLTLTKYNCLYKEGINTSNVITVNIPENTVLKATAIITHHEEQYVMAEVEYKGTKGYLRIDNKTNLAAIERITNVNSPSILVVEDGIFLYDKPNGNKVDVTLDIEREYDAKYMAFDKANYEEEWYSVNVQGKIYYFNVKENRSSFLEKNATKFARIARDVELVSLKDTSKTINKLYEDDIIAFYYTYSIPSNQGLKTYIYVKDLGFIKDTDYNKVDVMEIDDVPNMEEAIGFDGYLVDEDEEVEEPTIIDVDKTIDVKEVVIGIIVLVVALTLTVIIILVTINKKNKKEEARENEVEEDTEDSTN